MSWLESEFGTDKPIVAMLHLQAMPSDPRYADAEGMAGVLAAAVRELDALQSGGVDAVMFSNEFSLPYLTRSEPITAICMARVIGELRRDIAVPFGVNVLWDGRASIDLAVATGATFVREIFSGVYASDFGLWDTNFGEVARHRRQVGGNGVRLMFNIVPEASVYLGERDVASIARTTVFNCQPDALCVSGATAGAPTDLSLLRKVKEAAGDVPVFTNTGVRLDSVGEHLAVADGVVIGTAFKKDGKFENPADPARVAEFMQEVKAFRAAASAGVPE